MMIILLLMVFCQLSVAVAAPSDNGREWEALLAQVMTAEDMESDNWEDTYSLLCQLEENPLDLNVATREELEQLPFLTAQQVMGIMEYLYYYGPMKSLNELRLIRQLDYPEISLLRCFCYVDAGHDQEKFPTLKKMLTGGRHEVMANVRIPFYERQGQKDGYLGSPLRHWTRYQYTYRDYMKWGFLGSQDAGEPFFSGGNKTGYDFYSYFLQVKRYGRIENAVVGKYKLSAGLGLVVNNGFGMGKLSTLQQLGRSVQTVRPHASRSQSGYFQGAAATVRLSPWWNVTGFLSYRALDATLNDDGTARSLLTDGYHRTVSEMAKKDNTHATDAGAHVAWRRGGLHAGATAVYTRLDRELKPDVKPLYRRYYPQGQDFLNVSADYGYLHPRFALNGETAINRDGALATINTLSFSAGDEWDVMLLQRFYSYRYNALYARSVSEGGQVQNESAVYVGLTWHPSPSFRLQAYTDYAYAAWARYQVSQSSRAWDNLLNVTYSRPSWDLTARYRLHLRQKDDDTKAALVDYTEHRSKLAFTWHAGEHWSSSTQADGMMTTGNGREWGYMLSQSAYANWTAMKLSGSAGYFRTTSYASRIFCYERGPLYSFTFPAYYGEGVRVMMMAQGVIGKRLTLTAKLGYTHYTDRSTIGSGLQQIDSSSQTDLDLQVRWKF